MEVTEPSVTWVALLMMGLHGPWPYGPSFKGDI